ncbi:MAG: long-chain acyl-CoA synthetase [Solirubrobacteraceae bacterium]|nr:long-chain acyl-CoA synthetase [Solirubrobacteraceae bacterium]
MVMPGEVAEGGGSDMGSRADIGVRAAVLDGRAGRRAALAMVPGRMLNLASLLTESAARRPDSVALRLGPLTTTYAELDELSARTAALLRARGVGAGDALAIMLPNLPEFAIAYYGALRAGATVVPLNVLLKRGEVAFHLRDSGARLLVATALAPYFDEAAAGAAEAGAEVLPVPLPVGDPGEHRLLRDLAAEHEPMWDLTRREASDIAVLLYTSGTTGTPKGAQLTHSNLLWNAHLCATSIIQIEADDVLVGALPLFHAFGQTVGLNAAVRAGATLSLLPRFEAEGALELIETTGATIYLGVPTMYTAMLNAESAERRDLSKLRLCVSGGAAIPVEVLRGFEERFGCRVLEGYGLSETSPVASFNHPDRPSRAGSIGTPIWGVEMHVVDDDGNRLPSGEPGEIVVRGHNVMAGYHGRPDDTAQVLDEDGWLRTGDVATVDEDGYFFIVDRKKDLIIRGGYNVYPREIEEVLHQHPAVMDAAVLGIAHAELGEEVAAAVQLKPGAEADADELRAFVKERVASYKYPRVVRIVEELPKGPTGKLLKREIRIEG